MIPALFVFHNDTCDTMTLDYGDVYMCSSSVTTVITVTTVIKKTDRAVTIGTIKIGAGLSSLAYLRIEDEKLFAADNIFLSASIFAHKVGFAVHYFALATVCRSGDWQSKVKSKLKKIKITIELFIHDKKGLLKNQKARCIRHDYLCGNLFLFIAVYAHYRYVFLWKS